MEDTLKDVGAIDGGGFMEFRTDTGKGCYVDDGTVAHTLPHA